MKYVKYGTKVRKGSSNVKKVSCWEFSASANDLHEAGVLARRASGVIRSLNDSLFGLRPTCEIEGFDHRQHAAMRKFRDETELEKYCNYMAELVGLCNDPHPNFERRNSGFRYSTASGLASISLDKKGDSWEVSGKFNAYNPDIIRKSLIQEGFKVEGVKST